ncbi:MAG: TetR/AcrR family transcriptional regulator [Candidatus Sabulitectum sp.]|nr:TetR/AcrR family transcriptional regulator [Candidatus Sabulitectum sp.]
MVRKKKEVAHRILLAAVKVFDKYGLHKTTMRDIAESAGMSKSSLYYYFRSKKDILSAVVKLESATLMEKLSMAVQQSISPQKRLRAYIMTRMHLLFELSVYYASLRETYLEQYAFIEQERKAFTAFEISAVSEILTDGVSKGVFQGRDILVAAKTIIIFMKALELRLIISKSMEDLDSTVDTMLEILFHGLEIR